MAAKILEFPVDASKVKDIITDYDVLSEVSETIDLNKKNVEIQEIIVGLKQTLRANKQLSALSAPQIGYKKRIICVNFNGDIRSFINPLITKVDGFELSREKCISIVGKEFIRPRYSRISVTYQTPLGEIKSVELAGMAARVFQHHIDHLDGLLLSDVGLEIDEEFDKATEEERREVINLYLDSLDLTASQIDIEIDNDEEAKKLDKDVKFIDAVRSGKVQLEQIPWTEEQIKEYEKAKAEQEKAVKAEERKMKKEQKKQYSE